MEMLPETHESEIVLVFKLVELLLDELVSHDLVANTVKISINDEDNTSSLYVVLTKHIIYHLLLFPAVEHLRFLTLQFNCSSFTKFGILSYTHLVFDEISQHLLIFLWPFHEPLIILEALFHSSKRFQCCPCKLFVDFCLVR